MTLLAGKLYDPSTLATKATNALLAMTALDTTNLRLSFTVPANGAVLVRLRGAFEGVTTTSLPTVLFGVLEGSTVKGRSLPVGAALGSVATSRNGLESLFVVPGLTPAANLTWDAAYSVDVASSTGGSIRYGGPNDTTTDNAAGGFAFEIYDCANLLGAVLYDPAAAVSKVTTALLAMTALDTTNLRITFTAPATGNVLVRIRCAVQTASSFPQILVGVLDGATVRGRAVGAGNAVGATLAAEVMDATFVVTGLTPSSSYSWDAAYGVEVLVTSTNLRYGGPNDTSANNAYGAFQYEVWAV